MRGSELLLRKLTIPDLIARVANSCWRDLVPGRQCGGAISLRVLLDQPRRGRLPRGAKPDLNDRGLRPADDPARNPFAKGVSWSLTAQSQIMRTDPNRAASLQRIASG